MESRQPKEYVLLAVPKCSELENNQK